MLSGVGPKEELKKHDIKVIKDLKVGSTNYVQQMIFNDSIPVKPDR